MQIIVHFLVFICFLKGEKQANMDTPLYANKNLILYEKEKNRATWTLLINNSTRFDCIIIHTYVNVITKRSSAEIDSL